MSDQSSRDALLVLFSGVLEFNNLFASYKGEGTGAVRHMFSHHILKPERTPIEANVWGTSKSSGSFSNLFRSRLMHLLDYRDAPFEVAFDSRGKASSKAPPFSGRVDAWPTSGEVKSRGIYLSCGSSDDTGLPSGSIDLIVTDPPFFDNVHYSELADFFYSWQRLHPRGFLNGSDTTRDPREVQDADSSQFSAKLGAVLKECRRVLRDEGLLVFTYHHSRAEGWTSLLSAVVGAGFSIFNAHPVKAEMSVATPKAQAKEPIQLDVILVCRKREEDDRTPKTLHEAFESAVARANRKIARLVSAGLKLSLNDRRVVMISQFIADAGPVASAEASVSALLQYRDALDKAAAASGPGGVAVTTDGGSGALTSHQRQTSLPF